MTTNILKTITCAHEIFVCGERAKYAEFGNDTPEKPLQGLC
jgi:hypothetical protein